MLGGAAAAASSQVSLGLSALTFIFYIEWSAIIWRDPVSMFLHLDDVRALIAVRMIRLAAILLKQGAFPRTITKPCLSRY